MEPQGAQHGADIERMVDPLEFRRQMYSQMRSTGIINTVKSQLRTQLLSQLQKGQVVKLQPSPGDNPSLLRRALNSMIAEYLAAFGYGYSLSVFREESGVEAGPLLSEQELLDLLKLEPGTMLYTAYQRTKHTGRTGHAFALQLLEAVTEAAAGSRGSETATQTAGGERFQLEMQLQQLEDGYGSRVRAERLRPTAGLEERLALYRQEIEEQAKAEVTRQVERIREVEIASMRLEEAVKFRRTMEGERLELDRLHHDRLAKLRQREEEVLEKLRRQQRDVENVAFEHRQKILREEERLSTWRMEQSHLIDARQEQLKNLERTLECRERAVAAREKDAERKLAEASEALVTAGQTARTDVERDYLELKSGLQHQRMQLEVDRNRVMELRSEATAEIASARAKEDRLRTLEGARAEAEARAAAFAADNEMLRLQAERCQGEAQQARLELARRIATATDSADAMLHNAAGALSMLEAESTTARNAVVQLHELQEELAHSQRNVQSATAQRDSLTNENQVLKRQLSALMEEASAMAGRVEQLEGLIMEAIAGRDSALHDVENLTLSCDQVRRDAAELQRQLHRYRAEARSLRVQLAAHSSLARAGRPSSRDVDLKRASPPGQPGGFSPQRRPGTGASCYSTSYSAAIRHPTAGAASSAAGAAATDALQRNAPPWSSSLASATPAARPVACLRSPAMDRLGELKHQEEALAAELAAFSRTNARDLDVAARDVNAAMGRVLLAQNEGTMAVAAAQSPTRSSRSGMLAGWAAPGVAADAQSFAPAPHVFDMYGPPAAGSSQLQYQHPYEGVGHQFQEPWRGHGQLSASPQQAHNLLQQQLQHTEHTAHNHRRLAQYSSTLPVPAAVLSIQPHCSDSTTTILTGQQEHFPAFVPPPTLPTSPSHTLTAPQQLQQQPQQPVALLGEATSLPHPVLAWTLQPRVADPAASTLATTAAAAAQPLPVHAALQLGSGSGPFDAPAACAPPGNVHNLPAGNASGEGLPPALPASPAPAPVMAVAAAVNIVPFGIAVVDNLGLEVAPIAPDTKAAPVSPAPCSTLPEPESEAPPPLPSWQDMQAAQEAKRRLLQQQQEQRVAEQRAADQARRQREREEEYERQAVAAATTAATQHSSADEAASECGSSTGSLRGSTAVPRGLAAQVVQQEQLLPEDDSSILAVEAPRVLQDSTHQDSSLLHAGSSHSLDEVYQAAAGRLAGISDSDEEGSALDETHSLRREYSDDGSVF